MKVSELLERKINPNYTKGLTADEKKVMKAEIERFSKMKHTDPKAYPKDWEADREYRERTKTPHKSKYTQKYHQMFGEETNVDTALKNKAEKSGISISVLRKVYNRGLAAWRTGHRPGVSQHQWAMARVNSFIVGGKAKSVDKDLLEERFKFKDADWPDAEGLFASGSAEKIAAWLWRTRTKNGKKHVKSMYGATVNFVNANGENKKYAGKMQRVRDIIAKKAEKLSDSEKV